MVWRSYGRAETMQPAVCLHCFDLHQHLATFVYCMSKVCHIQIWGGRVEILQSAPSVIGLWLLTYIHAVRGGDITIYSHCMKRRYHNVRGLWSVTVSVETALGEPIIDSHVNICQCNASVTFSKTMVCKSVWWPTLWYSLSFVWRHLVNVDCELLLNNTWQSYDHYWQWFPLGLHWDMKGTHFKGNYRNEPTFWTKWIWL